MARTIAVLPSLKKIYPSENYKLAMNCDALVSPYNNEITKRHFIDRNKMIARVCHQLVVIETKEKTGCVYVCREKYRINQTYYACHLVRNKEIIDKACFYEDVADKYDWSKVII